MADKFKAPFAGASKGSIVKFTGNDVAIMGGLGLPEAERGPLDTKEDKEHPLYDERLKLKLAPEWVGNIKANGVKVGINIVLIDGIPFVKNGRQRVRGARVASAGLDKPIELTGTVEAAGTAVEMLRDMIITNVSTEDTTAVKIAKLKRVMALGDTLEQAANAFAIKPATAKMWLAYDEKALASVKEAVNKNRIPSTTGMDIARLPADKQEAALQAVIATNKEPGSAPKRGGNAAAANRIIQAAAGNNPGIKDRKTMKRYQEMVDAVKPPAKETDWYQGVSDAISLILGADDVDPRLVALLKVLDATPVVTVTKTSEAEKPAAAVPATTAPVVQVAKPKPKAKKAPQATPVVPDNDVE